MESRRLFSLSKNPGFQQVKTGVLAAAMLFCVGAVHLVTEAQASPDGSAAYSTVPSTRSRFFHPYRRTETIMEHSVTSSSRIPAQEPTITS